MTIVFKYGDRAADPAVFGGNPVYSSGITCWATVAMPYNYTKNFPDFMIFEVERCDPRCPLNPAVPPVINVGDRYPAYRVRTIGGASGLAAVADTDQGLDIPPHSELWAVSGTFPPFARNQPVVQMGPDSAGGNNTLYTQAQFRDRRGLIGNLVYPTVTDVTNFTNLGFPTTNFSSGIGTFLGTGYNAFDVSEDHIFQFEVSCADYAGYSYLSSTPAAQYGTTANTQARDNQKFLLPDVKLPNPSVNGQGYIVDVLEENSIRKVIRVRARTPVQGFNIWTYYYLMFKSPAIMFSTRIHWSERNPIPNTSIPNSNPLLKRVYQIFACSYAPFNILQKNISLPNIFASPISQDRSFPLNQNGTIDFNSVDLPVNIPERLRTTNMGVLPHNYYGNFYFPIDTWPGNPPNTPFPYSCKVFGDDIVGNVVYYGPSGNSVPATDAYLNITRKQRWMKEGRGHYFYGIIYAIDNLPTGSEEWVPFKHRDYYQFKQFDDVGPPEGTFIWSERNCTP